MNSISLTGNLTKDVEVATTKNGEKVASFTLAVNGIKKDETYFFNCVAFKRTAEFLEGTAKGTKLGVVGTLTQRSYENKEGQRVIAYEIIVSNFDYLSPKRETAPFKPAVDDIAPALNNTDDFDADISNIPDKDLPF